MIQPLDITNTGKWTKSKSIGRDINPIDKAYEDLANAIVYKAARDYQHALITLHFNPSDWKAQARKNEVLKFFRSGLYRMLTNVDGEYLVRVITEQVIERDWKRFYVGYED